MNNSQEKVTYPSITVEQFLTSVSKAELTLLAGEKGLHRKIDRPRVQKLGLIIAGFPEFIHKERVHLVGNTEIAYLNRLTPKEKIKSLKPIFDLEISCLVITKGLPAPQEMIKLAKETDTPLLSSPLRTTFVIQYITEGLQDVLAPFTHKHGVLVDVFGVGVLMKGGSSIGKSETALDLIVRKHRLVSDDIIEIRKKGEILIGKAPDITMGRMELRGLGIINISELFGIVALRDEKIIDLIVNLQPAEQFSEVDRLGIDEKYEEIMGVKIPSINLPVASGRNIANLLEIAASNLLLKRKGKYSAQEFVIKQRDRLKHRK
ncbi:MAG: HPr(Ser) kinase/phosphatase [Thermoanaerobaculaceae bacterium]|nr:HPr(Ser) kinase/phosphatase [Thermoanaerobaculaceae bacterium]